MCYFRYGRSDDVIIRDCDGKNIGVSGTTIVQQCLQLGLLDEDHIDLVPVLLGEGIRLFDHLAEPVDLEQIGVIQGTGVTHFQFRVVK